MSHPLFDPPNLDGFATADECHEASRVLLDLARYALAKSRAMRLRADGDVTAALVTENHCQNIYESLPEWARW